MIVTTSGILLVCGEEIDLNQCLTFNPVKVLTSWKWQAKFTDVAQRFAAHKADIQYNLQLHAGVTITATNVTVNAVDHKVDELMRMVFTLMQSAEERELDAFIVESGGPDTVTKDDQLLSKLLSIQKTRGESRQKRELTVVDTRKEIGKDIEQVLKVSDGQLDPPDFNFNPMTGKRDSVQPEI